MSNHFTYPLYSSKALPSGSRPSPAPRWGYQAAKVGVTGSCTNRNCPRDNCRPFEPSNSPLGHSQVAPDPPRPQDEATRWPWLELRGHKPTITVQGMISYHLSHLAALYVTPKWLQTLPGPKMGLPSGHCQGYGVMHQPKLSRR